MLGTKDSQRLIAAAVAQVATTGVPICVAVLDAGGHLLAFGRMDGCVLGCIDLAIRKAKTALLFGCASEAVWEYCRPGAPGPALEHSNGGLAPIAGGLPIIGADVVMLGAIGVSGGPPAQDRDVAQAALAAISA